MIWVKGRLIVLGTARWGNVTWAAEAVELSMTPNMHAALWIWRGSKLGNTTTSRPTKLGWWMESERPPALVAETGPGEILHSLDDVDNLWDKRVYETVSYNASSETRSRPLTYEVLKTERCCVSLSASPVAPVTTKTISSWWWPAGIGGRRLPRAILVSPGRQGDSAGSWTLPLVALGRSTARSRTRPVSDRRNASRSQYTSRF